MKTKNKLTLLAIAAMISTQAIAADNAAIDNAILQLMTNGNFVTNPGTVGICGGMDDDQIVGGDGADFLRPNTSNNSFGASQTGALLTSVQYPYKVATVPAPEAASLFTSVQGPYQIQGAQTGSSYTSVQYPYTLTSPSGGTPSMTTDGGGWTLNIAGGLGNDTIANGTMQRSSSAGFYADSTGAFPLTAPSSTTASNLNPIVAGAGLGGGPHITGSAGNDSLVDRQILQLMTTGSLHGNDGDDTITGDGGADSLWGDNGTDSFVFGTTTYGFVYGTTNR